MDCNCLGQSSMIRCLTIITAVTFCATLHFDMQARAFPFPSLSLSRWQKIKIHTVGMQRSLTVQTFKGDETLVDVEWQPQTFDI